jgi:hypothetical protein
MRRLAWPTLIVAGLSCSPGGEPTPIKAEAPAASVEPAATPPATSTPVAERTECTLAEPSAQCCERDFGLDLDALASACGLGEYKGELRAPTACQHRFANANGEIVAFSIAEFRGRSFDAAVSHHMRGFFGPKVGDAIAKPGVVDGVHFSGDGNRGWAFVPGWSAPRRVAWGQDACPQAKLQPVLAGMKAAAEPARAARGAAPPAGGVPAGTDEGTERSLLHEYRDTQTETPDVPALPDHSKRLIVLLLQAVTDAPPAREAALAKLVHADARWGLPDRRELRARPVFDPTANEFVHTLRAAASRFSAEAKFTCPPLSPQGSQAARAGDSPMYCYFQSTDGLDMLVFKLSAVAGRAGIEYVGMFDVRPAKPTRADGEPPAPPVRPMDVKRAESAGTRGPRGPVAPGPIPPRGAAALPPTSPTP